METNLDTTQFPFLIELSKTDSLGIICGGRFAIHHVNFRFNLASLTNFMASLSFQGKKKHLLSSYSEFTSELINQSSASCQRLYCTDVIMQLSLKVWPSDVNK